VIRSIDSEFGSIFIRYLLERDIDPQLDYYFDSPKAYLEEIGFNTEKMPSRDQMRAGSLERLKADQANNALPRVVVAELEGRAVAMVFLDLRNQVDKIPRMHFHIFNPSLRGKGLGGKIFMSAVHEFSRLHGIKKFWIEPKASNARMNGLMKKLGFKHLEDCVTPARESVHEFLASRYEILV